MYDFKACLAARYLQTEDVKLRAAPENCKDGCCFGLTTLWAGRHFTQKNEGPEARIKAITTDAQKIFRAQQAYETAGGAAGREKESGPWQAAGFTVGDYKGKNVATGDDYAKTAGETLVDMLITAGRKHHYTAVAFRNAKGWHQMVCYHSGGKIFGIASHLYFFDPNGGEFKVPHGDMREFFMGYWFEARRAAKLFDINYISWAPLTPA